MRLLQHNAGMVVNARRFALAAAVGLVASACTISTAPAVSTDSVTASSSPVAAIPTSGASTAPSAAPSESVVAVTPSPLAIPTASPSAEATQRPRPSRSPRPTIEPTATPTASPTDTPTPTETPTPTPAGLPDLIIESYAIPATVTHDVESHGGMYVQNVGPGAAGAFAVDFSGYCDNYTFSDAPHRVEGLAPGADAFIRLSFSFPLDTNCHVAVTIDHDNAVQESNESNNEVSVAVTVQ